MGRGGMDLNKRLMALVMTIILVLSLLLSVTFFSQKGKKEIIEESEIDFTIVVSIKNLGQAPAHNVPLRLAVPMENSPNQFVEELEFSETPERKTNDSWGNEYIHYTIPVIDPQKVKEITINIVLKQISIDYNLQSVKAGGFPGDFNRYLSESPYINVNHPDIVDLARSIALDSGSELYDITWNTYEWIIENIYYQQIPGEWDAQTTLKNGEGGSAELGNLFVSLLRANGIPARRLSGWGNHFTKGEELFLTRFAHGWVEFYVSDMGWVPADPTWGKSQKYDNFAKTDPDHVILTKGAGNHFFWRGPFDEPFGETEISTDYKLVVGEIITKNRSIKRDIIAFSVFVPPVVFALFILIKKVKQRRM
jgi:hypothetical protein